VPPQRIDQQLYATPTDESHHEVDGVRGRHLGAELMQDRRLAVRVGEHRRVEERRERTLDRLRAPVGKTSQQRNQHTRWIRQLVAIHILLCVDE
jgi:hypothetical protein